jgi:apolipoprotein N-acyltransferase
MTRLATLTGWRRYAAAAILGLLAAGALPPIHVIPVLFVAIPGLLILISAQPTWRGAAWMGFWFGMGHHVAGLYWITEAILFEAARFWWLVPLAVPALAAVMAVFVAAACGVARRVRPGWPRGVALAGAWVLSDLARQFIATGFPWNPLGSVWAIPGPVGDAFLQPAAWVSVHGLTLATLLVAALPLMWRRRGWIAACAVVLAWGGAGLLRLAGPQPAAPGVMVVLVQGNIAQGRKWDRAFMDETFSRYLDMTHEGVVEAGEGPVVVLWPETASPYQIGSDAEARAAVANASAPATALVGTVRWDADGLPRNSLMAVAGPGPVTALYDKWHLVPFGEYQPSWMPLPIQLVPGDGFGAGSGPATLHLPGLPPVGPLICYEAIFPGQVAASDRPAWLANVTNDAWFGNSSGPRQHLAAARLRAVEEGLPLARAANTGISAVFDGFGREQGRLGMRETGLVVATLPGALPPTPFARFGLAIPGFLALSCLIIAWRGRRTRPMIVDAARSRI